MYPESKQCAGCCTTTIARFVCSRIPWSLANVPYWHHFTCGSGAGPGLEEVRPKDFGADYAAGMNECYKLDNDAYGHMRSCPEMILKYERLLPMSFRGVLLLPVMAKVINIRSTNTC